MTLANIETIIFLMLENRSFDQMLGYLSMGGPSGSLPVDGLRSDAEWLASYANVANGTEYPIRKISGKLPIRQDPPHGWKSIGQQIEIAPRGPGPQKMGGFADTYIRAHKRIDDPGVVMGYYNAGDVATFDFLARNFCVCDKWFSAVPLGTQANRLMSMAGESRVLDNVVGLPDQELAYDWLEERNIPWRVYVSGGYAPFFLMMKRWTLNIVRSLARSTGPFRRFSTFRRDWQGPEKMPAVIFIEPEYADAPMSDPNDDHPPAPIANGQDFVREIYGIVTSNPDRWSKTLLIVTYDEHGGFFDHVPPPDLETEINGVTLKTLGPRVPALLISPFVSAGHVFSEPLDHTSFLQLIAERFGKGEAYSEAVAARQASLGRISNALSAAREGRPPAMPPSPTIAKPKIRARPTKPTAPDTPNAAAIDAIFRDLEVSHADLIDQPGWQEMKMYLSTNAPPTPKHHDNIGDIAEL